MINTQNYSDTIRNLKIAILKSRYRAASLANRELLTLYFKVGKLLSDKVRENKWGTKVMERLSNDLQTELPGLKGFSSTNLKRMRQFYEEWNLTIEISPTSSDQLQITQYLINIISPMTSDQLVHTSLENFFSDFVRIGFSHHYEILIKTTKIWERIFYIQKTANEFWSVENLKQHLKNELFQKEGILPNNFHKTIANPDIRSKALQSFKDEYLLDFINLEDPDDENEKLIENEIVRNIKKFLLSLGTHFAFIGNQYRFIIDNNEYFIDLLFYNRKLQCLVALDLKRGKFKPEYVGKMNFYLSALDETLKFPHEQDSIGIILCREKNNKVVEFSFRDFNKSMGVAIYKTANELPERFKDFLPDADTLKKLMD